MGVKMDQYEAEVQQDCSYDNNDNYDRHPEVQQVSSCDDNINRQREIHVLQDSSCNNDLNKRLEQDSSCDDNMNRQREIHVLQDNSCNNDLNKRREQDSSCDDNDMDKQREQDSSWDDDDINKRQEQDSSCDDDNMDKQREQDSSCGDNDMDKRQEQDSSCGDNDMNKQREIQQDSSWGDDDMNKRQEQDSSCDDDNMDKQREQDSTCSCEDSDMDREDMLSNYASEMYLQRWSQDTGAREGICNYKTTELMNQHHSDSKVNIIENNSLEECAQLEATVDYDGISLVSYNSVQDGQPAPAAKKCTDTRLSPYHLDIGEETATAWKGYGGNIYFDPLNCQPLRILTSKSVKTQTQKASGKGHDPHHQAPSLQQERKYKLQHESSLPVLIGGNNNNMFVSHTGDTELGSLKMDRTPRQRNRTTEPLSIPSQRGKICKGFSERIVLQTLRKIKKPKRCVSAPEPLVVSGLSGQVVDSSFEPIYGVTNCNTKIRAAEFGLHGRNTFPIIFSTGKMMQCSNGTFLESLSLPTLTDDFNQNTTISTGRNQNSLDTVVSVQEPKPVLIIPFGAFDDPVGDQESLVSISLKKKQKQEKLNKPKHVKDSDKKKSDFLIECKVNEKENVKLKTSIPGGTKSRRKSTEIEKQKLVSKSAPVTRQRYQEFPTQQDNKVCQKTHSDHTEPKSTTSAIPSKVPCQYRNPTIGKQHDKDFQKVHGLRKEAKTKQTLLVPQITSTSPETDTQFKREISNASLSNYLSAVSSQPPQLSETRQMVVPRLSYTKRARPSCVQSASGCSDGSQYFAEFDQSEMNQDQLLAQSRALRAGYISGYNSDQRRVNKQFKVTLSTSDKATDSSCTSSRSQGLAHSTSPRQGVLKRTSSLTKSAPRLGVKFSLDSLGTTGGRLGINGTEYQLPIIGRQSGTS